MLRRRHGRLGGLVRSPRFLLGVAIVITVAALYLSARRSRFGPLALRPPDERDRVGGPVLAAAVLAGHHPPRDLVEDDVMMRRRPGRLGGLVRSLRFLLGVAIVITVAALYLFVFTRGALL